MTDFPNGAGPAVLDELDLPRPVLEQPNDTARVLAVCVRCCWSDPAGPLWPGASIPFGRVAAAFEAMTARDEAASHRAVVAALRRLSWSGWLLWDEPPRSVRLGPRVATWNQADLTTLRELCRSMPLPDPNSPDSPQGTPHDAGRCDIAKAQTTAMSHRPSSAGRGDLDDEGTDGDHEDEGDGDD